ncbi:hypothetical protein ACQX5M_10005 [Corynebacterium diphtheriae]
MGNIFIKLHLLDALRKKSSYAAVVQGCCVTVRLCGRGERQLCGCGERLLCGRAAVRLCGCECRFLLVAGYKKQFSTHEPVSPHNLLEI